MGSGRQTLRRSWPWARIGKRGIMSMLAPVEQITASTLRSVPSVVTMEFLVKWEMGVLMKSTLSWVRASR